MAARTASLTGADIAPNAKIGSGLKLPHPHGVVIGHGCEIGSDCTILQGVTLGERYTSEGHKYPKIGDNVVIGAGAKLLGGIEVGSRAKIGANSVVLRDIPCGATVVGVPGRLACQSSSYLSSEQFTI
jgi:serine O-acetyltransferase